ncbi:hypothetical protein POM88_005111 [Heracleum sosnowskyi]|uniref:GDSL esterase/lipase n=1 Tax=Heracleum sosnowskyi TaxID=360622 RepID=A0AAD8JMW4_9APIA|nr:hypothetical protein POM88_005111 [Heracleum sosnowskyi]
MLLAGWCSIVVHWFSKSSRSSSDNIRRTTTFQQLLEKYTIALGTFKQLRILLHISIHAEVTLHEILMIMGSEALIKLPKNVTVPGLIVFGDSIADQGNNNNLSSIMKCNFPPYGIDFTGGLATGRFTNARTPSDMIDAELGIKELVPAYLDPSLQIKDLSTDASFASGGTRYDPQTSKLVRTILDIGCGCGNFEAHLFSKGLLTMCLLEFEAGSQVQPTPERGLPAMLGSLTSMQFPYPSLSFDMIHCAQCGVDREKKVQQAEQLTGVPLQKILAGMEQVTEECY